MVTPKRPINDKGKLRLRFTHAGTRFTLSNLGDYSNKVARLHANSICDRITLDILSGNFTPTNNAELAAKYCPNAVEPKKTLVEQPADKSGIIKRLKERLGVTYHSTDKSLLNILTEHSIRLDDEVDAQKFMDWLKKERQLKPATMQRYLNTLKACSPLFKNIKIKSAGAKSLVRPFTKEEVVRILDWFANTHYYNYVYFCLNTGMRPSEVIGLQWKNVDFIHKEIIVASVLARDHDNTSKRVRKPTKAGVARLFPINIHLEQFLLRLKEGVTDKEQLVFLSPTGTSIDDHNFVNRWWHKCLDECGIESIDFYNCRRTFISHYLEATKDVVKCASLTHGTNSGIKTIWDHYAGVINRVEVPDLY